MNINLIPLLLGISLTTSLSAATERMCFGQVPIETSSELVAKITIAENDYFTTNKCKRYFSYYEKHLDFPQAECEFNKEQLSLDKGYAPFGVFFRGTDSTGKDNISSYDWEIKDAAGSILTTYNAFNASYVFERPGEYSATLTITDNNGVQSSDTKNITVWERDGNDYYADSAIGDDRYNGLAQTPDNNCDANTAPLNSCSGPWKTATRALGELEPYNVTNFPNGEYTADSICLGTETVDIVQYHVGNFKVFRSSTFLESAALKDKDGEYLPRIPTQLCSKTVAKRSTVLRPGDQILFNRGQQFNFETSVNTLKKYTATANGITYNYELLKTTPLVQTGHWSKAIGIHIGAYGSGTSPSINNTGKSSRAALHLRGVGMFGFAMSDLTFNLKSNIPNPFGTRATFAQINGNPINTLFNNINLKEMQQGILASTDRVAQGLFIFNSSIYDSIITQIYTAKSAEDIAIVNNTLDYSNNHLIYSSISHGLVYNNTLSRPAFGRTAFRLSGNNFTDPNNYVWISDNKISGWIDPRTKAEFGGAFNNGTRYNYSLVTIAPNNTKEKPIAFHDITFTRNTVSDAENLLSMGAGENIKVDHNTFQSASTRAVSFINASQVAFRPIRNVSINNNKFIDSSGIDYQSNFINLSNYSKTKCTDQFNHKKINIANNIFYSSNNRRRVFTFAPLSQGKDLSGIELPDLTLDQAKEFLDQELTLSNNQLISENSNTPTIQIGSYKKSYYPDSELNSDVDWSKYFQSSDNLYRLYNNLTTFTQQTNGSFSWASTDSMSIETLLASDITLNQPMPELTWDDIIAYAKENNISPNDLEVLILNQVLASNPSYSMPGINYSADLPIFDEIGNWLTSISSSVGDLFTSKEDQWNDAKKLAILNKISSNAVMISMTNK